MKRSILLFFLLFSFFGLFAQPYGNEWINYSQSYFKFKITQNGAYKISYTALSNAGFPVASINPKNIQVFGRGKEIPIHIEGESDNVFNTGDYIELYAQRNDGWMDVEMYDTPANLLNPYYSLINDTATYFITWNNSVNNKRFVNETDVSFGSYSTEPFFLAERINFRSDAYLHGYENQYGTTDPEPSIAEGYSGAYFVKNTNYSININTKNVYTSGPPATLKTKVIAASYAGNSSSADNRIRIRIPISGTLLVDQAFDGLNNSVQDYNFTSLSLSNFTTPLTEIRYESIDMGTVNGGHMSVPYAILTYPHTFDMESESSFGFRLPINTSASKSTLSFINFNASSTVRLYDLTNERRMTGQNVSGAYKMVIQNFGVEKECFLFSDNTLLSVTDIKPVTSSQRFVNYFSFGATSDYIVLTAKQLLSKANEYAAYRNTKGYNSLVVDVDDIYDQFASGISKHPLAIRKFSEYIVDKWLTVPKGFFIIGKGLEPKLARTDADNYQTSIIPTMGFPGTDGLLFARINNLQFVPAIPYGRIAVNNVLEVDNYLAKVKSYENQTPDLWMKRVLHFGGGTNSNEQLQIKNNLFNFENIIEAPLYGADVTSFFKTSSAPIQITTSDSLKNIIESGTSILNFYGHASGSGFDQNIDDPSVYNWGGRYPIIIANSCYIGNIHRLNGSSESAYNERFVLGQNIGAVGFLAQTGTGYLHMLGIYTSSLYRNLSVNYYGESIGKCQQETVREIQTTDFYVKAACLEISLHGDPVIKFNTQLKPDYSVTTKDVFFTPRNLSTDVDSFDVNIIISNIGKALDDSLAVEIKRFFPTSAQPKTFFKVIKAPLYQSTMVLRLPIDNINGVGFNEMEISLDPLGKFDELREDNNNVKIRFFIRSDDITPVYPYKYAVIPKNTVTLMATTGDPFAPVDNYVFELDKTDLFNSADKISQTVTQVGGVLKYTPPVTFEDSTVYFWRVAKVPAAGSAYKWKESSFQYITNKQGWGQAHFFQYKNNNYKFINYDRTDLKFKFADNKKKLLVKTWLDPNGNTQAYSTEYMLDNAVMDYGSCQGASAILIAVIDPKTLEPWGTRYINPSTGVVHNPNNNFGNANDNNQGQCNRYGIDKRFVFHTADVNQMNGLKNMLETKVPNGYYIVAYTYARGNFQSWANPAVINTFENLGASIASLPDERAWAFVVKKGDVSTAHQEVGGPGNVQVVLQEDLQCDWNFGEMVSEVVGPAIRWDEFIWKPYTSESPSYDSTKATIIGIKNDGSETVLFDNISTSTVNTSLTSVSASQYPLLKLKMYSKDDTTYTPSQLRRWHVLYQEAPESAVAPNLYSIKPATKVNEGEPIAFATTIENISQQPMDSLLVTYWLEDENRNLKILKTEYLDSLRVGDTLHTSVSFTTDNVPGLNSLWLEVNPKNAATGLYDQLEQFHFNNFAQFDINVAADKTNPILDVTFDGAHIMDGEIVSAKPLIVMQLNDENKYKALSDTSMFAIYLKYPNEDISKRIYFNSDLGEIMKFTPAVLPVNKAKIEYNPTLLLDGIYELQVQGKDASNNKSGDVEYKIKFEVVNKSSITSVLNYPNPFSTSTRFVFTLTGSQVPTYMKIQIMTVTGKVIREITEAELGNIRIGKNITEYAWDGKDEFGDPLANGIYLYKVFARINGENIDKRETSSDQYFTKEFGKMYLMR